MKSIKLLWIAAVLFAACNTETKTETKTDSTSTSMDTTAMVPAKPSNMMFVKHKVANFSKWMASYEMGDSMRQAAGLHSFVIGRGVDDSNTVVVFVRMDDLQKAKAFATGPDLKAAMQKSGVTGAPDVRYIDMQSLNTDPAAANGTTRILITQKVKDWATWKTVFDSHHDTRMKNGLIDRAVGFNPDDNHWVYAAFTVTDMAKANEFIMSKDLKDKMAEAGVEGKPEFFTYNVVKQY